MYIIHAIEDGLKILGFNRQVIKKVSKEKSLEDIFLSTLFVNYMIVLVCFLVIVAVGGQLMIEDRALNMPVVMGLLLMYPFAYNIVVYALYAFFGLMAELVNSKNHVRPLLSAGFHSAIAYAPIIYVMTLILTASVQFGAMLFAAFALYYLIDMFHIISTVYKFSLPQTLIVIFVPIIIIGIGLMLFLTLMPAVGEAMISGLFK
ncbi:MAG: hypothetical protein ACLFPL_02895 [Candidatus Nanoarchaeia archaeon]